MNNITLGLLSLLLVGDIYKVSASLGILFTVSYFYRFFLSGRGVVRLIMMMCILASGAFLTSLERDVFSIAFAGLCIAVTIHCPARDLEVSRSYLVLTRLHLFWAWAMFAEVIFLGGQVWLSEINCLYGERAIGSCAAPLYQVNGINFARMYGLAAEPAAYGYFLVLNIIYLHRVSPGRHVVLKRIMVGTLIMTFSMSALIFAALASFLYFIQQFFYKSSELRMRIATYVALLLVPLGIVCILSILNYLNPSYFDVIAARTSTRLMDVLTFQDLSAIKRTIATWQPVSQILEANPSGVGLLEAESAIKSVTTTVRYNDSYVVVAGQAASSLAFYLVGYGTVLFLLVVSLVCANCGFLSAIAVGSGWLFFPYAVTPAAIFSIFFITRLFSREHTPLRTIDGEVVRSHKGY